MTTVITWLTDKDDFPPLEQALTEPNGLLAAGDSLPSSRLLAAYRLGIFPWYSDQQPVLWWSPDPRMVLFPGEFLMRGCAMPRSDASGTWITEDIIAAYSELHRIGHAHSVETWIDGELAGGLYGVSLGRAFYGESMFARVSDASKIAFAHLVHQLKRWQFGMIDCQMNTAHLARFGAREISRVEFSRKLTELVNYPKPAVSWQFENDLFE